MQRRTIDLLKQIGVAALYVLLVHIDYRYFEDGAMVDSFGAAGGLVLAVLLIGGKQYFWGVFLGALIACATTGGTLLTAIGIAIGNTLEVLASAWLLTRNGKFDTALQSLRSYLLLILAASIGSINGALNGATTLLFAGLLTSETYLTSMVHWWMDDVLGITLVTPLILICWQARNNWRGTKQIAEAALLLGLTFLAGQIIFLGWLHDSIGYMAKGYLMFLLITLVAVRLGAHGTVIAVTMVAAMSLLGAHQGVGYFADDITQTGLVNHWFYTLILSIVGMALATFLAGHKQSENALRRSEIKFRTLYDSTSDAVMLLDENGFFDCNQATLAMIGCATKEEFCSKHPADLSPPEQPCGTNSLILANRHIAAAMEEGSRRFEWMSKRADTGKTFLADVLLSAMELEGRVVLQAVIRDITEQKRAGEELKRFFNLVPDMVCIASTDGYFKKVNRAWQTTLGYTEREILATPFLDFIHPDDREATMKEVERQMSGETTIQFSNRYRCKDGSYKWLEWDATPAVDNTLLFASARDVTERKISRDALRESEASLRAILDNSPYLVWLKNTDGRYVKVNKIYADYARLKSVQQAVGKTDFDLWPKELAEKYRADDAGVIATRRQKFLEEPSLDGDKMHWVETFKTPIIDENGNVLGTTGFSRDITERKIAEQQLRALSTHIQEAREEEKASIAREIHDELGGTLTALKMDAYWLSRKLPVNEETAPYLDRIASMSQLIDNAVGGTRRIISGMRPTVLDDLGLLAAIEWQAMEFHGHSGIECRVNCIEDEANLDKQRSIALFRILQEALTNISRHSRASKVRIEFLHSEKEVILEIRDNGCGMPENHIGASKSYGMLGMTERVEQLGGKIIFSSPPGGGFSVMVTLPLPAKEWSA